MASTRRPSARAVAKAFELAKPHPVRDRVRKKLTENACDAESLAARSLIEAARFVREEKDVDEVLGLLFEAVLHLGEARGHRNALVDLCEDGSRILEDEP